MFMVGSLAQGEAIGRGPVGSHVPRPRPVVGQLRGSLVASSNAGDPLQRGRTDVLGTVSRLKSLAGSPGGDGGR